jgi:hypothetical protein
MNVSQDQGQTFSLSNMNEYCSSCSARVVACPHRGLKTRPLALPPNSTHVSFHHPGLITKTWFDFGKIESLLADGSEAEKDDFDKEVTSAWTSDIPVYPFLMH